MEYGWTAVLLSEKMATVTPSWPWPDSLDALAAAPRHHKLVLDNDRVRVLDTHIPVGDRVPVHTHRWPAVYYTISGGDFVRYDPDGNVLLDTRIHPNPTGEPARFIESLPPHSVENVGTSEIHLISVELKPR
jgi:hypothetical protein